MNMCMAGDFTVFPTALFRFALKCGMFGNIHIFTFFIKHEQHFTTPTLYATEMLGHARSRRQKLEAYLYCSSYPPQ